MKSGAPTYPSQYVVHWLHSNVISQCDAEAVWLVCRVMTISWTTAQNPPPQYVQVSMTAKQKSCLLFSSCKE